MIFKTYFLIFLSIVAQLVICNVAMSQDKLFQPELEKKYVQHFEQGRELLRNGKIAESIEQLSSVVKESPNFYMAHYDLGLAYLRNKEYIEAIKYLSEALNIKDKEKIAAATIYNSIGWAYFMEGDYKTAESYYLLGLQQDNQALLSNQSKKKLLNNIGLLYLYQGNYELAETYFSKAIEQYGSSLASKYLNMVSALQEQADKAPERENINPVTTLLGNTINLETYNNENAGFWKAFWIILGGLWGFWIISSMLKEMIEKAVDN